MQEVGEIAHVANSGRLIVRLGSRVGEGQVLCDERGVRIARVMELIGPIARPYASASALTNNTSRLAGRALFAAAPEEGGNAAPAGGRGPGGRRR